MFSPVERMCEIVYVCVIKVAECVCGGWSESPTRHNVYVCVGVYFWHSLKTTGFLRVE